MKDHYETDPIAAARDALFEMTPDQLEHMLYDVRAEHQNAVAHELDDEPQKLEILQMYERRAQSLGVTAT